MFYKFFSANYLVDMCAPHFMVEFSINICFEFSSTYKSCTLFSPQTSCLRVITPFILRSYPFCFSW